MPLIPSGIALIASFLFVPERPRWLAAQDRHEDAVAALKILKGSRSDDEAIRTEMAEIQNQLVVRQQVLHGVTISTVVKEIATIPSYRRRFFLAMVMQIVAQWSGRNGIIYYIPQVRGVSSDFIDHSLTMEDIRLRWGGWLEYVSYHIRCLRNYKACLHHGLCMGSH